MFPDVIEFEYNGQKYEMKLVKDSKGNPDCYAIACPKCDKRAVLSFDSHEIKVHDNKITVSPSLVCPAYCGWHTWLKDGVAVDC